MKLYYLHVVSSHTHTHTHTHSNANSSLAQSPMFHEATNDGGQLNIATAP